MTIAHQEVLYNSSMVRAYELFYRGCRINSYLGALKIFSVILLVYPLPYHYVICHMAVFNTIHTLHIEQFVVTTLYLG